jgi:regulatory protein
VPRAVVEIHAPPATCRRIEPRRPASAKSAMRRARPSRVGRIAVRRRIHVDRGVAVRARSKSCSLVPYFAARNGRRARSGAGPFCLMVGTVAQTWPWPPDSLRSARPLTAAKAGRNGAELCRRFATSRAKLIAYMSRKLRERGWDRPSDPPVEALADTLVGLAMSTTCLRAVQGRVADRTRLWRAAVRQALTIAGIGREQAPSARELARTRSARRPCALPGARRSDPSPSVARSRKRERARAAHGPRRPPLWPARRLST